MFFKSIAVILYEYLSCSELYLEITFLLGYLFLIEKLINNNIKSNVRIEVKNK